MNQALLVVNADDFGISEGANQAIIDAHLNGIVTSTSLLANGGAFDHAVELAKKHPSLGVGVHFTLTEGQPIANNVPELLAANGELPLSNQPYARALLQGRLPRAAIHREFEAQVNRIIDAGIHPTHADGHKYIHLLPGIAPIAAEIAQKFAIPFMRVPHRFTESFSLKRATRLPGLLILFGMAQLAYRTTKKAKLRTIDRFAGFIDTGHLTQATIQKLLHKPKPGLTELVCHPAYAGTGHYPWMSEFDFATETAAVSDATLRQWLETQGWTLRNFSTPGR